MRPIPWKEQRAGMTLVEVLVAVSIFTIVMAALYTMSYSFGDTAEVQFALSTNMDDTRLVLQEAVSELRQAARQSINMSNLPGNEIRYRIPVDLDGNGTAVNVSGRVELGPERILKLDTDDLTGDGITRTQLILIDTGLPAGEQVRVLANYLNDGTETTDAAGVFGPANDTNGNGRRDCGFEVRPQGSGLVLLVQARQHSRKGHDYITELSHFVLPRN